MSISESDRRAIFVGLEPILGTEVADNLMSMLPNQPASHLVTRDDMHANTIMMRGEMAQLRGEMSEIRGEMSEIRGEMSEIRGELSELRGEFKGDIADLRVTMQRWMSGAMAANTVALVTALAT